MVVVFVVVESTRARSVINKKKNRKWCIVCVRVRIYSSSKLQELQKNPYVEMFGFSRFQRSNQQTESFLTQESHFKKRREESYRTYFVRRK